MSQRKKTPKLLATLIQKHAEYMDYAEERIRVKTTLPVDNQAAHIQSVSVEEMVGQATGAFVMLENALMEYGCYAGFMYVGFAKRQRNTDGTISTSRESVGPDHPEFREWARVYFTRTETGLK